MTTIVGATQKIVVNKATHNVSIQGYGPPGPQGPTGPQGPEGPITSFGNLTDVDVSGIRDLSPPVWNATTSQWEASTGLVVGDASTYAKLQVSNDALQLVANNNTGRPYISFWNQDSSGNLDRKGYIGFPAAANDTSAIFVMSDQGNVIVEGSTFSGDNLTVPGDMTAGTINGLNLSGGNVVPSGRQIVASHTNGYVYFGWINTVSGTAGTIDRIYCSQDQFIRYLSPANFRAQVTDGVYATSGHTHSDYVTSNASDTMSGVLTINQTGNALLIGTTTGSTANIIFRTSSNSAAITHDTTLTLYARNSANTAFATYRGILSDASTQRGKSNISTRTNMLDEVKRVRVVSFDWLDEAVQANNGRTLGVIAEELHAIDPNLVHLGADGLPEGVSPTALASLALGGLQELSARVETLEAQLAGK